MTGPASPRLSPMAAMANALYRRFNSLAAPHIARLEQQLAAAKTVNARLKGGQP